MYDCKSLKTLLERNVDLIELNSDEKYDTLCRKVIGCHVFNNNLVHII